MKTTAAKKALNGILAIDKQIGWHLMRGLDFDHLKTAYEKAQAKYLAAGGTHAEMVSALMAAKKAA